jgi:hypothetical protein
MDKKLQREIADKLIEVMPTMWFFKRGESFTLRDVHSNFYRSVQTQFGVNMKFPELREIMVLVEEAGRVKMIPRTHKSQEDFYVRVDITSQLLKKKWCNPVPWEHDSVR